MRAIFIAILLLLIPSSGSAEIYQGILPKDTLGDVKARFPHAQFTKITPAWAQPKDFLYSITGEGLSGTIIVKFDDGRPFWLIMLDTALKDGSSQAHINFL